MAIDIASIIRRAADRYPERRALVFEDRVWSYAEWNQRINRAAWALSEMGVHPGDRVAFFLTNSEGSVTTYFACQKLGAIAVPCNFRLSSGELEVILRDSGARVLIYSKWATDTVIGVASRLKSVHDYISAARDPEMVSAGHHHWETLIGQSPSDAEPVHRNQAKTIAALIYTSGTTGRPKGVIHTHGNDFSIATNCVMEYSLRRSDVALHIAPLYHVGGLQAFFLPHVLVGGTNVVLGRYQLEETLEAIQREKVTSLFAVPTQLEEILDHPQRDRYQLSSLKMITTGGASSKASTLTRVASELCPGVFNGYGLTEASLALVLPPEDAHLRPESCGKPTLITEVRLVRTNSGETFPDPDDLAPDGEAGQLIVRGPQVTPGYWNNTIATRKKIHHGWLYTGDLFQRDKQGFYIFLGRTDDMIVSGGENIQPKEVEEVILSCPGVSDVAVIGLPHQRWGQAVTAVFVGQTAPDKVLEYCKISERLARYKCPKDAIAVTALPRNATGKVTRFTLLERYQDFYAVSELNSSTQKKRKDET